MGVETDNETGKVIRPIFMIDILCHPEFLKEEEVVSTLYQAWMQAMDEILKNSSTDTPKRVLTLCINLVLTSVTTYKKSYRFVGEEQC